MRRIILITVAVISAMACHSCIRTEVVLEDKSILSSLELVIDNDSNEWEINTLRQMRIKYKPDDAIISDITFEYSEELFEIIPTREQYVFDVKALKEGKGSIMVTMNGMRSQVLEFDIIDSTPQKVSPKISLFKVKTATDEARTLCPAQFYCNYGDRLHLSVESETKGLTYSFYSADETVIRTVWSKEVEWLISAALPGLTEVQITVTEPDGTVWIYNYEIMVYGYISLTSKCDPIDNIAGFIVNDHPFEDLSGEFYITSTLTGWPGKRTYMAYSLTVPPCEQSFTLAAGEDYSDIIDFHEQSDEIYDKGYELNTNGDRDWWGPNRMDMHFLVTLSDPYIIIDEIIDDNDREIPNFINFFTQATFEQVGVSTFPKGSEDLVSPEGWRPHAANR